MRIAHARRENKHHFVAVVCSTASLVAKRRVAWYGDVVLPRYRLRIVAELWVFAFAGPPALPMRDLLLCAQTLAALSSGREVHSGGRGGRRGWQVGGARALLAFAIRHDSPHFALCVWRMFVDGRVPAACVNLLSAYGGALRFRMLASVQKLPMFVSPASGGAAG